MQLSNILTSPQYALDSTDMILSVFIGAEALGDISESESSSNSQFVHGETEAESKVTFPKLPKASALSQT